MVRNCTSQLSPFSGVFGSSWFQDDISAVVGVLLRQKRDKKGPEESGGPVWGNTKEELYQDQEHHYT